MDNTTSSTAVNERKTGIVQRWFGRYGYIFVTYKDRYFLPLAEFDAARLPFVGETVTFNFVPAPILKGVADGRILPVAKNVKPVKAVFDEADTAGKANDKGSL